MELLGVMGGVFVVQLTDSDIVRRTVVLFVDDPETVRRPVGVRTDLLPVKDGVDRPVDDGVMVLDVELLRDGRLRLRVPEFSFDGDCDVDNFGVNDRVGVSRDFVSVP